MTPYLDDGDVRLYHGDALETLRKLPDRSVDMVATSPPFYGLRNYNTEGQIGLEETPDQWVTNLVAVFRECRRVLADHGTLWVEIGDSYNSRLDGSFGNWDSAQTGKETSKRKIGRNSWSGTWKGAKPKDLLGQPWMLAFALRADGWYLRSEIIWARPNPMPESVTDRPTKAHSTVFLLSKQPRYFYDTDAIREEAEYGRREWTSIAGNVAGLGDADGFGQTRSGNGRGTATVRDFRNPPQEETLDPSLPHEAPRGPDGRRQTRVVAKDGSAQHRDGERWPNGGRNSRSVWNIATEPTPFAHFATWPQKLVARMIQAGTSERGKCPECGKPWERETEAVPDGRKFMGQRASVNDGYTHGYTPGVATTNVTLGWSPSCDCAADPAPCTVLDPFAGSGTTLLVARHHQRHAIGIELNPQYCQLAAQRLSQLSLLTQ